MIQVNDKSMKENLQEAIQLLYKTAPDLQTISQGYSLYKGYLKAVKSVFLAQNVKNPIEISNCFCNALWDGVFSQDYYFESKSMKYGYDSPLLYGLRIMSGTGSCRHISFLFNDFIEQFSIPSSYAIGSLIKIDQEKDKTIRHAINLLEVNGQKLALDFTNGWYYTFLSSNQLMNPKGDYILVLDQDQNQKALEILSLPPLQKEEFQRLNHHFKMHFQEDKMSVLEAHLYALNRKSMPLLSRICQIEETYSKPEIQKSKVLKK